MISRENDTVKIEVSENDLIKSIALLKDMKEFCLEQREVDEGRKEMAGALTVAIETMKAFWVEHFTEEE